MLFSDKQIVILIGVGLAASIYAAEQAKAAASSIDPLNNDNVFAGFSNGVTQAITGRQVDKFGRPLTFGAWLAGA